MVETYSSHASTGQRVWRICTACCESKRNGSIVLRKARSSKYLSNFNSTKEAPKLIAFCKYSMYKFKLHYLLVLLAVIKIHLQPPFNWYLKILFQPKNKTFTHFFNARTGKCESLAESAETQIIILNANSRKFAIITRSRPLYRGKKLICACAAGRWK